MTLRDATSALQRLLGIEQDGIPGPITVAHAIAAVRERDALRTRLNELGAPAGGRSGPSRGTLTLGGPKTGEIDGKEGFRLSPAGTSLIHSFEQCILTAYPDPGSHNGLPWTIGWGSTGPDVKRGTKWTQAEADERFRKDIEGREKKLNDILGSTPTTRAQFDAMLSLGYNIGMEALAGSTVMRRHKAGDHEGAATAFGLWNKNDGAVMRGLVKRRAAEAEMYRGGS